MTLILVSGLLIFVKMSTTNALKMEEYAEKRRKSEQAAKAAKARYEGPQESDIAPWAAELISGLGLSPEALFSEEIPPEVAAFLPAIKGFLGSGGGEKILSALKGTQQEQPGQNPPPNMGFI